MKPIVRTELRDLENALTAATVRWHDARAWVQNAKLAIAYSLVIVALSLFEYGARGAVALTITLVAFIGWRIETRKALVAIAAYHAACAALSKVENSRREEAVASRFNQRGAYVPKDAA